MAVNLLASHPKRATGGKSKSHCRHASTIGQILSEQQEACVERVKSCLTAWGPATEQTTSPLYEEDGYWRGPIWGPSTMLVVMGLADDWRQRTRRRGQQTLYRPLPTKRLRRKLRRPQRRPLQRQSLHLDGGCLPAFGRGCAPLPNGIHPHWRCQGFFTRASPQMTQYGISFCHWAICETTLRCQVAAQ